MIQTAKAIELIDKRRHAGGPLKELASRGANSGKSASETAAIVGTSTKTVERARNVFADEDVPGTTIPPKDKVTTKVIGNDYRDKPGRV